MAHEIKIGEELFPSKAKAIEFYRKILNSGDIGRTVSEQEFGWLIDVLARHPRAGEKIKSGIKSFKISSAPKFGNRFFLLSRVDGSEEDFSYRKCIEGGHNPFTEFSNACRAVVHERLHSWKANQMDGKEVKCAITSELLTFSNAHVDHKSPLTFSVIVHSFSKANEIELTKVEYNREGLGLELMDADLAARFDKYHKEMAVLRIVAARENLRGAYAARITPTKNDGTLT